MTTAAYIEAFGSPGVGKSYVASCLLESLPSHHSSVQVEAFPMKREHRLIRVFGKIALSLRYLPHLLSYRKKLISLVRRTSWRSYPSAGRGLLNWMQLLSMIHYLHRNNQPILLRQGVFQALWSLRFRANETSIEPFPMREWIDLTLSVLPSRQIVILNVVASEQVVRSRLANRHEGQSVLDKQGAARDEVLEFSERIVNEIKSELVDLAMKGHLRIVDFDNDSDALTDCELRPLAHKLGITNMEVE